VSSYRCPTCSKVHTVVVDAVPLTHDEAVALYEASDDFEQDALDWAATTSELPGELVDAILNAYRQSAHYTTAIDDVANRDREL
jgi:hypothetical protein